MKKTAMLSVLIIIILTFFIADTLYAAGGGRGTGPARPAVRAARHDRDNNPPGPAGGAGTNWENPPGPAGGPGASPDRRPVVATGAVTTESIAASTTTAVTPINPSPQQSAVGTVPEDLKEKAVANEPWEKLADTNKDGIVDAVEIRQWRDRNKHKSNNPPGPAGGPGASPDVVRRADKDDNPPGPAGGRGTNWENPPGPRGGPGASPNRKR